MGTGGGTAGRCDARIRFAKQVSMFRTLVAESGSEALRAETAHVGRSAFAKPRGGKSRVFSERKPLHRQKTVSGAKQETRFDLADEKKSRKPLERFLAHHRSLGLTREVQRRVTRLSLRFREQHNGELEVDESRAPEHIRPGVA